MNKYPKINETGNSSRIKSKFVQPENKYFALGNTWEDISYPVFNECFSFFNLIYGSHMMLYF